MTVRICFSAGSLAGQTFELAAGSSLSLGRSRTCDLKASEPDVSGRHLVFRRGAGAGVTVEVASSRKTLFNGTSVSMSDSFPVKNGDTFRCGGELVCRVECDDEDATVPPPVETAPSASGESDKTVLPGGAHQSQTVRPMAAGQTAAALPRQAVTPSSKTGAVSESNSTIAIQTRIASDEELEDIRRAYRARRTRRTLSIIGPALIFLAAALGAWIWFRPKTEEFVSWPETTDGRSMDRNVIVAPYLALTVPDSSNCRVEKSEDGADIWTFAGIRHDVPMHFQAVMSSSTNELTIGRDKSFERWLRSHRDADASFNPSTDRRRFWTALQSGNGILVNYVSYTRRIGVEDYYGYLMFLRFETAVHVVFAEVLLRDRWRAEPLLRGNLRNFLIFAGRRAPLAWEGHDSIRPGNCPKCDIEEAERYFSADGKLAAAYWDAVWYRIRSALIKAKIMGNEKLLERARKLLTRMRDVQTDWYAEQRNAWNKADRIGDERAKLSVQAAAESAFSEDFRNYDYRYDSIKRKDWK